MQPFDMVPPSSLFADCREEPDERDGFVLYTHPVTSLAQLDPFQGYPVPSEWRYRPAAPRSSRARRIENVGDQWQRQLFSRAHARGGKRPV